MRIRTTLAAGLVLVGLASAAHGQQVVHEGVGYDPAVAVAGETGDFVVVWTGTDRSERPGTGSAGVFARLFHPSGRPKGPAFRVYQDTAGDQMQPKVAADEQGNFVVVWQGGTWVRGTNVYPGGDGAGKGVFAQRFDRHGQRVGPPIRASRAVAGSQVTPNVAMDPDGSFLVVWQDCPRYDQFGEDCPSLRVGRFSATGAPSGEELEIPVLRNVGIGGPAALPTPEIAVKPEGFAIGWTELEACYKWFQEAFPVVLHFTDSGRPVGERFRLDDGDCDDATGWRLAALATSRTGSSAAFFNGLRKSFQLFGPDAVPLGRRKVIGQWCGSPCDGQIADAAMDADGRLAVIWYHHSGGLEEPDRHSFVAQFFDPAGRPHGDLVEVTSSPWTLFEPAAAFDKNGSLLVVWNQSFSSNGGASFENRLLFRRIRRR